MGSKREPLVVLLIDRGDGDMRALVGEGTQQERARVIATIAEATTMWGGVVTRVALGDGPGDVAIGGQSKVMPRD